MYVVATIITETTTKPREAVKNRIDKTFWKIGMQRLISNWREERFALAEPV
jgi:hypothetical protein